MSSVDPIKVRTAKIKKMFHRLYARDEEIEALKLKIKELTEALAVHTANEKSLQRIIDAGRPRTSVLSRRKSIAISQQAVSQVEETILSRRHSLRKSFADESILSAFRTLPEMDLDSPTLKKICDSVTKLHSESPLLGVQLITKLTPKQTVPELIVEFKDPKEGITFRRFSLVRPKIVEQVGFWCRLHKFPTDVEATAVGRQRSSSVILK